MRECGAELKKPIRSCWVITCSSSSGSMFCKCLHASCNACVTELTFNVEHVHAVDVQVSSEFIGNHLTGQIEAVFSIAVILRGSGFPGPGKLQRILSSLMLMLGWPGSTAAPVVHGATAASGPGVIPASLTSHAVRSLLAGACKL